MACMENGLARAGFGPGDQEAGEEAPPSSLLLVGCLRGFSQASRLRPRRALGFLPHPLPFLLGVGVGDPSPPSRPQPLSQLSCDKQGRHRQLAGDNVRINDKIWKAFSITLGREKTCHGCVVFPDSGFLRVASLLARQRSCFGSRG